MLQQKLGHLNGHISDHWTILSLIFCDGLRLVLCCEKYIMILHNHSAGQVIPAFGTRTFITVFTTTRHWSLYWARWIQSEPFHPFSLRSVLILSSHLHLTKWQNYYKIRKYARQTALDCLLCSSQRKRVNSFQAL